MPKPTWTIYGYRSTGQPRLDHQGYTVRDRAPLHAEGFASEADATLWLMDHVMKHGVSEIDAVMVRLDNGIDQNGERHIIRRIGHGRAWWE